MQIEISRSPVEYHIPDAGEMRELLAAIRASPIYVRLAACASSGEGNLLERTSDNLAVRKLLVLERIFRETEPRTILETGTNKGFFGLAAWMLCPTLDELDTFDIAPGSEAAAKIVDEVLFTRFTLGDTRETLPAWTQGAELAWIDGGHWNGVAKSDIGQAIRLGIPVILVDDMDIPEVSDDVHIVLAEHPEFEMDDIALTYPIAVLRLRPRVRTPRAAVKSAAVKPVAVKAAAAKPATP